MTYLKQAAVILVAGVVGLLWSTGAQADYIGNPVKDLGQGKLAIAGLYTEDTLGAVGQYGVSDAGTVEARFGLWDTEGIDGTVIGGGYFHTLEQTTDLDGKMLRFGVFGMYRIFSADESGVKFEFKTLQAGGGATMEPADRLHLYGLAAFEKWESEATVSYPALPPPFGPGGTVNETVSDDGTSIGIAVGVEYEATPKLRVGGELQAGFEYDEDQLGIFARFAL